jgi:hypothetical protein
VPNAPTGGVAHSGAIQHSGRTRRSGSCRHVYPVAIARAQQSRSRRWLAIGSVAALVATAGTVALIRAVASTEGAAPTSAAATSQPPTTAAATTVVATTVPPVTNHLDAPLGLGSAGEPVRALQQRLTALGFAPGPVDGQFGNLTQAAVWAFEKLVLQVPRNDATGVVTDEMWQFMQQPIEIRPRRPDAATANHTEIYLPEQVVAFFVDDRPAMITHMSSGSGEVWREEVTIDVGEYGTEHGSAPLVRGEIGWSDTPGGVFSFDRFVTGVRNSALGGMWNPAYFNYGIAIHGALNVPLHPASHGCVRIPLTLSETFQQFISQGDVVYVWDGVKEPEVYGEQIPRFNIIDPDYVPAPTSTTIAPPTTTR